MNVSPQRFRVALAGTWVLLLTLAGGTAFAQRSLAPREGGMSQPGVRMAAMPGRQFRYGLFSRPSPMMYRPAGYVPPHERAMAGRVVSESPELIETGVVYQDGAVVESEDGAMVAPDGAMILNDGGNLFGGCSSCGGGSCGSCGSCGGQFLPCPMFSIKAMAVTTGVVGFKNAANRGSSGSFGFSQSVNWTTHLPCLDRSGIYAQIGARGVESELHNSVLTTDKRNQLFVTGGLFRRVDWGLQFGAVLDYLRDDWYVQNNVSQVRMEASWVFPEAHEVGFRLTKWTSSQVNPSTYNYGGVPITSTDTWRAEDTYRFFYRFRSQMFPAGRGEFNGGFTGDGAGLLGANAVMPLGPWVALQSNFTYLIPKQNSPANGLPGSTEAWNLGFGMVIFPGGELNKHLSRYDAPLFDVAGNGDLILGRR